MGTIFNLLAGGIGYMEKITVIVLCVVTVVLTLFNIVLVVSLNKRNKRLAKREEVLAPDDENKEE